MRLADLAEKVGCSESMLSKIENGKANPSLNTLSKIATTLEVDVRDFFTANDDRVIICKKGQHPSLDTSTYPIDPNIVFKAITPHTPDQLLQVDIHVIPPDKGTVGPLSHEGQEAGMVLEGRLELTVNNVVYNLCAGDSFVSIQITLTDTEIPATQPLRLSGLIPLHISIPLSTDNPIQVS